jgi:hypothetical protein
VYGYNANVSTITGPTEKICGAQDIQYCINPVCGATSYTWNPPPSGLTPMNPTNLNCIDYSVANNVTINNAYITMHANFGGGCIGPTASIGPITGTEIPDPGDISGNRTPNAGTLETYGMPNYCGSYTWSITPGNQGSEWIVSGSTGYNTSIFDVIWLCPGTYFISCTISNCCGYSLNSSSTPATITVSGTPCRLGKPDQQNELSGHTGSTILIGLNGNFIINFDEIPANMIIYDLSGRKISHFENITSQKFEFGAEFAPGVYFANVESENRLREVIKIIKSMSKK